MANSLTIQAGGQTITVAIKDEGGSNTTRMSINGSLTTFPQTITTDTTYTFLAGTYAVSCLIDGLECFGQKMYFRGSESTTIAPAPTPQQLAQYDASATAGGAVAAIYDPLASYGAKFDGTTDDSAAIQAAIDAASAAGGGVVELRGAVNSGNTVGHRIKINTTLRLKDGVWLRGVGSATTLVGTASPIIALPTSGAVPDRMAVTDLFLQAPAGIGLLLDTTGLTGSYQLGWPRVTIQRVTVTDAVGDAFKMVNSAVIEARFIDCVSIRHGGVGFNIGSTDNMLTNCTAGGGSSHGFWIQGGNNKLTGCKGYGNTGTGIWLAGAGRHNASGCEAQDNTLAGFTIDSYWNTVTGVSDSNGTAGFQVAGGNNTINGTAMYGGGGSGQVTPIGFNFTGAFALGNVVIGTSNCATPVQGDARNSAQVNSSTSGRGGLAATAAKIYGCSYDISPPVFGTTGAEWYTRLKNQLPLSAITSYGVSGEWTVQAAINAIGTAPNSGGGYQAPPGGAPYPANNRGLVFLGTLINDYAAILDRTASPVVATAITTKGLNGLVQALQAWLAVVTSATRTEFVIGDCTGTWTTSTNGAASGGTQFFTSTVGDSASKTITVPAAGYVWLLTLSGDPASAVVPAAFTYQVDGGATTTVSGAVLQCKQYKESGGSTITYTAMAVKIAAAAGSHTIKITHAGSAGQFLFVDALLSPATQPAVALIRQDTVPTVAGTIWTSGDLTNLAANKVLIDAAYATVVAQFPTAFMFPSGMTQTGFNATDGLHPSDLGMGQLEAGAANFINATVIPALYAGSAPGLVPVV